MTKRKTCSKCHKRKVVSKFYRQSKSSDGYAAQCKECMDVTRTKNKEKMASKPKTIPAEKLCRRCNVVKPASQFSEAPSGDGLYTYCKSCKNTMGKRHRVANAESLKQKDRERRATPEGKRKQRENNLQFRFGVGDEYYQERMKEQGGVCAICKRERRSDEKHFSIDHEHDADETRTKVHVKKRKAPPRLRGVLCESCNRGLGLANDDSDLLLKMARYLEGHAKP